MATLTSLSNEIIVTIGEFCPVPDLARFARTQRRFIDLLSASIYKRNFHDEPYRESCLLYAAAYKRMDILRIALANGANMNGRPLPPSPDLTTRSIQTGGLPPNFMKYNREHIAPRPLHVAVCNGDQEMVEFLLHHGAELDVAWLECEDDYQPTEQRLPSFMDEERIKRNPLPSSAIHDDLTLDLLIGKANGSGPAYLTNRKGISLVSILRVPMLRGLRNAYPLMFALSLPQSCNIGSILIRRGARLVKLRGYHGLCHAIVTGNIRLFDELLEHYPRSENGECSLRRRALCTLAENTRYVPMDMARHAFVKLWAPGSVSEHTEQFVFGARDAGIVFFSLVTGRYKEALQTLEQSQDASIGEFQADFACHFLHHVWWDGVEEADGPLAPRLPDSNPLATRVKLTKALLDRRGILSDCLQVSQSSDLHVTPLDLIAIDSAGCPHRSYALELLLSSMRRGIPVAAA